MARAARASRRRPGGGPSRATAHTSIAAPTPRGGGGVGVCGENSSPSFGKGGAVLPGISLGGLPNGLLAIRRGKRLPMNTERHRVEYELGPKS